RRRRLGRQRGQRCRRVAALCGRRRRGRRGLAAGRGRGRGLRAARGRVQLDELAGKNEGTVPEVVPARELPPVLAVAPGDGEQRFPGAHDVVVAAALGARRRAAGGEAQGAGDEERDRERRPPVRDPVAFHPPDSATHPAPTTATATTPQPMRSTYFGSIVAMRSPPSTISPATR